MIPAGYSPREMLNPSAGLPLSLSVFFVFTSFAKLSRRASVQRHTHYYIRP